MNAAAEIGVVFLLLLLNGLFSMSEMAVISARKGRLQQLANQGSKGAKAALELAANPGTFLSTVQVGISVVGIAAGAFGGSTLSEELTPLLSGFELLRPHASTYSFAFVVGLITYFSLVVGELIPKRIALQRPERVAVIAARPMMLLSRLVSPIVKILEISTTAMMRLSGSAASSDPPITEEEVKHLVEQGARAGVFEPAERDVIHRALQLTDRRISELMIPRTSMVWLDLSDPREKLIEIMIESRHSRYPVVQGSPDNVVGILRTKDALNHLLTGNELDIRPILLPPVFVPDSMPAFRVLEVFRESGRQLALVADEYGGVEGLVTVNDILQALVGDLRSIDHSDEPMVVEREDGSWLIDGTLAFSDMKRILALADFPEETQTYDTAAGFIMDRLQKIPAISDHFEYRGFRFEVVDMDRHRIDRILISRLP